KKVCGGDFHQQVTQGGLKLKPLDVVEFCALTDAEMKACAKVMESGIPWNKVKMYLTMEVNPFTTYEQLKTLAIYRGGKLVYESDGFRTTVEKLKAAKKKVESAAK